MTTQNRFPAIPLRGIVVYPKMVLSFSVSRPKSLAALKEASEGEGFLFLTTQRDALIQEPEREDLFEIGTVVRVKQVLSLPANMTHVVAEGLYRAKMVDFADEKGYLCAEVLPLDEVEEEDADLRTQAKIRMAIEHFEAYQKVSTKSSGVETVIHSISHTKPGQTADVITAGMHLSVDQKQAVLEMLSPRSRFEHVLRLLNHELQVLQLKREMEAKVKERMEQAQREYYLREQLKVIQEELGDKEGSETEIAAFTEKIAAKHLPENVAVVLQKEMRRLSRLQATSPEANTIRTYIETVLDLPWTEHSKEGFSLDRAEKILEADHYGMEKVKERILEHLAVRESAPSAHTPILCLVGPPGVGKTSVARSVAKCLNRNYVRMSLGGVKDEAEIRGHRKTYVGAMPGRIIAAMRQAGTVNPLLLLDEVDKLSSSYNGDPASALLEVLDAEQNFTFRDHYVEIPYDLSQVLFMCTANALEAIPGPLRDRMEIIELSGYTSREKREIALRHLYPKQLKAHGLQKNQLKVTEDGIDALIAGYTKEAGVRQLERKMESICRKAVKQRLGGNTKRITVNAENLEQYLGKPRFHYDAIAAKPLVGVVRGLAWTQAGGDTLSIEAATMAGTGKLTLTGNMGKVMEESAKTAFSYIRSKAEQLQIAEDFYQKTDIHIHIPEGAVPKDGPSAGITMATAMVSALTGAPVRNEVAMTGEVTLQGRVLPIGGLKEKILAAKRAGVLQVVLPAENERDLEEIPEDVKMGMEFFPVSEMAQVLDHAVIEGAQVWK